jgi:hypothetical protein
MLQEGCSPLQAKTNLVVSSQTMHITTDCTGTQQLAHPEHTQSRCETMQINRNRA